MDGKLSLEDYCKLYKVHGFEVILTIYYNLFQSISFYILISNYFIQR